MTEHDCRPGRQVQTPFGTGVLLHPVPRTRGQRWMVYADGKAYPVKVSELREPDDETSRPH